jgi:hypothetical protein
LYSDGLVILYAEYVYDIEQILAVSRRGEPHKLLDGLSQPALLAEEG